MEQRKDKHYLWIILLSCKYLQPNRIWKIDVKSFDFWVILIFSEIWETSALIITDGAKQTWWTKYLDSGSVIAFRLLCSSIKLLFLIKCSCEAETERLLYIGFLAKFCKCAPAKLKDNVDKVGILEVAEELHQMCVWHCLVKSERFEGKNCPKASTGQTWSPGTSSPSGGSWSRATLAQSCPPSPFRGKYFTGYNFSPAHVYLACCQILELIALCKSSLRI